MNVSIWIFINMSITNSVAVNTTLSFGFAVSTIPILSALIATVLIFVLVSTLVIALAVVLFCTYY